MITTILAEAQPTSWPDAALGIAGMALAAFIFWVSFK